MVTGTVAIFKKTPGIDVWPPSDLQFKCSSNSVYTPTPQLRFHPSANCWGPDN